jgi:protein-tyrosine kinase
MIKVKQTSAVIEKLQINSRARFSANELNDQEDHRRIGAILVEHNALTIEQAAKVLEVQRSSGDRFGAIAIRMGFCTQDDLKAGLVVQFQAPRLLGRDRDALAPHLQKILADYRLCNQFTRGLTHLELRWFTGSDERKCLSFVSGTAGEGCSTAVAVLSILLAQTDRKVLVIDAACQSASQLQLMGIDNPTVFLEDALTNPIRCTEAPTPLDPLDLHVLASHSPLETPKYLQSKQFAKLLEVACQHYDAILIDTPPLSERGDAYTLAMRSSGAVAIVRLQKSREDRTRELIGGLRDSCVEVVGVLGTNF